MNLIVSDANGIAVEGLLGPVTVGCRIGDLQDLRVAKSTLVIQAPDEPSDTGHRTNSSI